MKRRWLLAAVVAVVIAVFLGYRLLGPSEPSYQGMAVSRWIQVSNSDQLEEGLAAIGSEAIPYLIRALHRKDPLMTRFQIWVWQKLPPALQTKVFHFRPVASRQIRANALIGLCGFGPEAKSALPDLIALASGPEPDVYPLWALAEVGGSEPGAKEVLLNLLSHPDRSTRSYAAGRIFASKVKLPDAVPLLMQDLRDKKEKPYNELLALGVIGPSGAPAVPLIAEQMAEDPQIHGNALTALNGIGVGLKPAVPALVQILADGKSNFMPAVAEALMKAGPDAKPALPGLIQLQQDKDPLIRLMATLAVASINERPEEAVPVLVAELENQNREHAKTRWSPRLPGPQRLTALGFGCRETAAWFLGEIGPVASAAIPALTNALHGNRSWLRMMAARALYKITGRPESVLPTLLEALQPKDSSLCFLATYVLGEMGPDALPAREKLMEVRTYHLELRRAANEALEKIGSFDQ